MKKQKFCYSRFLSIILSLALLCSALVFPVSVNAATDDAAKAAAATALKTAWQEMYAAKGETFAYPNAILNNGAWVDCQGEGDRTLLPSEDPRLELYSDIDLSKYDNSSDVYVGYGKEFHGVNEKGNPVPYNGIRIQASSKGSHGSRSGFNFYVYAENVTKDIELKLNLGWYGNAPTLSTKTVTIPTGTNGYIRFKDTDFFPDGFRSVINTEEIWTMWVKVLSGFDKGAKLKFGSFQWVNSNTDLDSDTGLNLDGLTPDDLLVSALKLHTENVYYPEYIAKFEEALAALKACYGAKDLAVFELKAAWEEMETKSGVWGTYNGSTYTGVEEITLNSTKYYKLNTANLADTSNTGYTAKTRLYLSDKSKWKPVSNYGDGFYFYIYANEDIKAPITIAMHGGMIDGNSIKSGSYDLYYTIPAGTKAGTYIKVSDRDLFTEGYKTFKEMFETSNGQNTFAFFFTSHGDGVISFGPAYYYTRVTSSTATGIDFVNAANALDTSSYGNTEAFKEALANAKAAYADVFTASDLKAAFKDMLPDGKSTGYTDDTINAMTNDELLVAATSLHTNYGVYDEAKLTAFNTALEAFKNTAFTPEEAARINLKAAYNVLQTSVSLYSDYTTWDNSTASLKTATTEDEDKKYLGSAYIPLPETLGAASTYSANQKNATLTDYDGFYFYIKVGTKLAQDFTFGVNGKWSNADTDFEKFCVLPAGTEPGYYLFTDKDFYSQGYKVAKSIQNVDIVRFRVKPYSNCNIWIGSIYRFKYGATVPEGSDTWTLEKFANKTVNYIADNNYIISDDFRKLFADAQALGAGVYNGDFANGADGFTLPTNNTATVSDGNLTYNNVGWKIDPIKTKIVIAPNTDYVLTYRFKGSKYDKWYYSGPKLIGNNGNIVLPDGVKYFASNVNYTSDDSSGNNQNWVNNNTWINGFRINTADKWTNVAIRFNSGDNDYLNMSMAFQGDCNYTYDYFKLTKADDVEKGNINGDAETDICDLVRFKQFLNDGDTDIAFEAAKLNSTGTTVDNDDFNALRKYLLTGTFQ